MKNKLPTILLALSLTSLVGFTVGEEIELGSYLNARTKPEFLKYSKNILTTLPKGTKGEILAIKKFNSGNSGIKMKITNGHRAGESYWVYLNKKDPAIKIKNVKTNKEVWPEDVIAPKASNDYVEEVAPEQAAEAETLREVPARRDTDEHAVEETAKIASSALGRDSIEELITPQLPPCPQVATATPDPIALASDEDTSANPAILTPQSALAEINSGNLKFVGRDLMPGSDKNRSCIYQNDKVYVIYNNCMSSRSEAPATDIEVISKANGGKMTFYLEIFRDNGNKKPMSKMVRDEYKSGTFRLTYVNTPTPPKNMNVSQIKQYLSDSQDNRNACWMGSDFESANMNTKAQCLETPSTTYNNWAPSAESFWKNPPQEWYSTQSKLRKLVETTPF